jgi:hypothetical protein
MPGDDHVHGEGRIDVEGFQVVKNMDRLSCEADAFRIRILSCPIAGVDISSDRGDRRYLAKSVDDLWTSDVAGMDDVVDAG